jgi:hypothetical protein
MKCGKRLKTRFEFRRRETDLKTTGMKNEMTKEKNEEIEGERERLVK